MIKQRKHSKVFDMVEDELHAINKIKDASVSIRKFNKIRYPEPKHYSGEDVVRLRKKLRVSQAVLAYVTNNSESTIRQWESGEKKPGGANCRLLQILELNGIDILQVA
jgi:putative transcriptional regulator